MQGLGWYINRLSAMEPSEIVWRVKGVLREQLDLIRVPLGIVPTLPDQSASSLEYFTPGYSCSPVECDDWQHESSSNLASWRSRLTKKADQITRNQLTYFDLDAADHGSPINWHRDHSAEIDPPVKLSVLTDYREFSTFGDCKLVWEPNRHHQFVVLARAYVATRDIKYAEKLAELFRSWLDANSFGYGMNWKSILEHGVRLINWVWALDLIHGSDTIDGDLWERIQQNVYLAMWDIQRKFSRGSSANNHLVGEAAGVFIAACYFKDFPYSADWRRSSQQILEREILAQTYDSGCTREHAFGYQFFVIQFFLLCAQAGDRVGAPFSSRYKKRLHQMFRFMSEISADTGHPPNMGDCDDGYVVDLGELPDNPSELITAGGYEFDDPDLLMSDQSETAFWLYGFSEQTRAKQHRRNSVSFAESGYSVLRSDRIAVFFDCAELGYGPIAAHGHADCLSFSMSLDGRPILVDPGTFDYFTYPEWRNYFRSTRAHNTAEVDSESQSEMLGPFLWGKRATATRLGWTDDDGHTFVRGEHNGYERLSDPVVHRRALRLDKALNVLTIEDGFDCSGQHEASIYFHLDPSCSVSEIESRTARITSESGDILLTTSSGALSRLEPASDPSPGWVSTGYHQKQRSTAMVINLPVSGSTTNTLRICLDD